MRHATASNAGVPRAKPALGVGSRRGRLRFRAYWLITLGLLGLAIAMTAGYAPVHPTLGPVQKLIYFHLAVAINTFLGCLVTFVAGLAYLWQRDQRWDALGESGARASVALCAVVMLTGVIWAKQAWGVWWEWSSPLTFSLVLWLLYIGYLVTRRCLEHSERRAEICAVYGIVAFLDVPLVYLSVKLLPQQHPTSMDLTGPMQLTLIVWLVAMTMMTVGLIGTGYQLGVRRADPGRPA